MTKVPRRFGLSIAMILLYFTLPESWLDFARKRPFISGDELKSIALSFRAPPLPEFSEVDFPQAQLGQKIFFDTQFSSDGTVACASCHIPALHFTDRIAAAKGVGIGTRNTPSLLNHAWSDWFFWDGRADSLEAQALQPLETANEHGISRGRVLQLIYQHYLPDYEAAFGPMEPSLVALLQSLGERVWQAIPPLDDDKALEFDLSLSSYGVATIGSFRIQTKLIRDAHRQGKNPQTWFSRSALQLEPPPTDWTEQYESLSPTEQQALNLAFWNVGKALASFQRGLTAIDAPFDRFLSRLATADAPADAFNDEFHDRQWQGFQQFVQADCVSCHNGPMFSDQQFHNIGLDQLGEELDLGRVVGTRRALSNPFRCGFQLIEDGEQSESCRELEFLIVDHQETLGAFKTPSLRNVGLTAPYMHDGRFTTLDEVLDHYNRLDVEPAIGHREETLRPLKFDRDELESLKAFLQSLSSPVYSFFEQHEVTEAHNP
ncbi:MAG: cytochrome-c peroxidase [Oligoflexus sp.]